MSNSPLLALPYRAASQAQKHITHNEAISIIDGLVHLSVISRSLNAPPATPIDGDRYLLTTGPTGDWAGHAAQLALRMEGAWRFLDPRKGWRLWVETENILLIFDGTNWVAPPVPSTLQNLNLVGVNATADATNKLAVNSAAVLFNNVGNGVQFKINKNAATDTASILLQTGFSGRAEIGTAGDDDLHFKVSSNGSTFSESLIVNGATGLATFKNNLTLDPQSTDPAAPTNGQIWYNSTSGKLRARQNGSSIDVAAGAVIADGDKGDIIVSGSGSVWSLDAAQARATLSISNIDNTSDLNKPISTAATTALAAKEPTITTGSTTQYWRGDKAWTTLDKTAVGLANIDNTSDLNKPISTAAITALSAKEPSITAGSTTQYWRGDKTWTTLSPFATVGALATNALVVANNTAAPFATNIATDNQFLVGRTGLAPVFVTMGGDVTIAPSGVATVAGLTSKAPLASPSFTGVPSAPTATPLSNSTQIATTAYADLASAVVAANLPAQIQSRFLTLN